MSDVIVPSEVTIPDYVPMLKQGKGARAERGGCLLQIVSWFDTGDWTDRPACVWAKLRDLGITVNDSIAEGPRRRLYEAVPRLLGTQAAFEGMTALDPSLAYQFHRTFTARILGPLRRRLVNDVRLNDVRLPFNGYALAIDTPFVPMIDCASRLGSNRGGQGHDEWLVAWFSWCLDVFDEMTGTEFDPAAVSELEWAKLAEVQGRSVQPACV